MAEENVSGGSGEADAHSPCPPACVPFSLSGEATLRRRTHTVPVHLPTSAFSLLPTNFPLSPAAAAKRESAPAALTGRRSTCGRRGGSRRRRPRKEQFRLAAAAAAAAASEISFTPALPRERGAVSAGSGQRLQRHRAVGRGSWLRRRMRFDRLLPAGLGGRRLGAD